MSDYNENPEFAGLFSKVGHFFGNAAKSAGREISHVRDSVQSATGTVTKAIGKVPVVGAPIKTVLDASYHLASMPVDIVVDSALKGGRIDRVVAKHLNQAVREVKAVVPYAQMVVSTVPGIGTGLSGALGAGLALSNGQPIDKALMAGVVGAIPGGPVAQAAARVGMSAASAAVHHEKFDVKSAIGAATDALPIPPAAKEALHRGVEMTAAIASGKKVDAALADAALREGMAYLTPEAKKAFQSGLGVATGAIMQQVKAAHLPNVQGKLAETGLRLAKSVPAVAEARKLVGPGTHGFDIGHGIMSHTVGVNDLVHARALLKTPADKMGFDMALANKVGLVAHPPHPKLSPAAEAGRTIVHGMRGIPEPKKKTAIMQAITKSPSAAVGAKVAVQHIEVQKESWPVRVIKTIKKMFQH